VGKLGVEYLMKYCRIALALLILCETAWATHKPLFKMPYWHDRTKKPSLVEIFEGDDPTEIADRFCDEHSLDSMHHSTLVSEINRRLKRYRAKASGTGTNAAASAAKTAGARPPSSSTLHGGQEYRDQSSHTHSIASAGEQPTASSRLLFQISFGVNGGVRKVDLYEGESTETASKRFCSQHSLGIEHHQTLIRMLDMRMEQHVSDTQRTASNQPKKSSRRKRKHQAQPQRRKPKNQGVLHAASAAAASGVVANNNKQVQMAAAKANAKSTTGGPDDLYILPVHINGSEHLLSIKKKGAAIEDVASSFCEQLGISATDEFILHLSVIDGIKRHHTKMLKLLKLRQPITTLKFHFALPQ